MSVPITSAERECIYRFVLDKPMSEVAMRIEGLVTSLQEMDELYCTVQVDMSRAERAHASQVLIMARNRVANAIGRPAT